MQVFISNNIRLRDVPFPLKIQLTKELTMDNPAYLDAVKKKLPTWGLDKKLKLYILDGYDYILPRNTFNLIENLCRKLSLSFSPMYNRTTGAPVDFGSWDPNFQLRDYQAPIVPKALEKSGVIVAPAGAGKAQWVNSKVCTPMGFKAIKDLRIGTRINNITGGLSKVTGIFPQGLQDAYRVTFSDNSQTICTLDHLWNVRTRDAKADGKGYQTLTLKQILKRGYKTEKFDKRYGTTRIDYKFEIPRHEAVVFEAKDLNMHPYLLGALLGDGCFRHNRVMFSNSESDVLETIETLLPKTDYLRRVEDKKNDYMINGAGVKRKLGDLGLLDCYSYQKFIPEKFLSSGKLDRLWLLRGLLDTDGYQDKPGYYEYSTTSQRLANQVVFLIRSLGGNAKLRIKENPAYTYKGETRTGRTAYRIFITFDNDVVPTNSKKHSNKFKRSKTTETLRKIVNIEKIPEQLEMCCISTSSPDQLYLTDDFIVTHNTIIGINIIYKKSVPAVWLTHTKDLMYQFVLRAKKVLSDVGTIGIFGDGKINYGDGKLFVGTYQTLDRNPEIIEFLNSYVGLVVADECHHIPAPFFLEIVSKFKAERMLGITATPERKDKLEKLMYLALGEEIHRVERDNLYQEKTLVKPEIRLIKTDFEYNIGAVRVGSAIDAGGERLNYHDVTSKLIADSKRNELIVNTIIEYIKPGNFQLILTENIRHLHTLKDLLEEKTKTFQGFCIDAIHGSLQATAWRRIETFQEASTLKATGTILDYKDKNKKLYGQFVNYTPEELQKWKCTNEQRKRRLQNAYDKKIDVLFATQLAREGLDLPHLNILHLAFPKKGDGVNEAYNSKKDRWEHEQRKDGAALEQEVGRIMRRDPANPNKKALVVDYIDFKTGLFKSQYYTRRKVYKRLGLHVPNLPKDQELKTVEDWLDKMGF